MAGSQDLPLEAIKGGPVRLARFISAVFALAVLFGLPEAAFAHGGHEHGAAAFQESFAGNIDTVRDKICEAHGAGSLHTAQTPAILISNLPTPASSGCTFGCCCCQGASSCGGGHCSAQPAASGIIFDSSSDKSKSPRLREAYHQAAPIYGLDRPPKA